MATIRATERPNTAARSAFLSRDILPVDVGSAELAELDAAIRERSVFSAHVLEVDFLTTLRDQIGKLVNGMSPGAGQYTNPVTVRAALQDVLKKVGYEAADLDKGTIKDLTTYQRLHLIVETNLRMAQGYANYRRGLEADTLAQYPAAEFTRIYARQVPRGTHRTKEGAIVVDNPHYWQDRWVRAGGQVFDGKMIALKTDPVWVNVSRFKLPYGPPDFNSGYGQLPVKRKEAIRLGLLSPGQKVQPPSIPSFAPVLPEPENLDNPSFLEAYLHQLRMSSLAGT
jgi:hypothetical protein